MRAGIWVTILVASFTLYFVVVLRYLSISSAPHVWLSTGHNNNTGGNSNISPSNPKQANDEFFLHPEQHVFRQPKKLQLHWNVTREARRPDGVLKEVYLINGTCPHVIELIDNFINHTAGLFPGPTIEARSGDEIEVTIVNGISNETDDGIAVHWHGMLMKGKLLSLTMFARNIKPIIGFNEMDGVVGVTQCRVAAGNTFTYKFQIHKEQHGTFWYHAHSAVKRADGLYGGLVVHKPVNDEMTQSDMSLYEYDNEKLLLIGDWYHWTADRVLAEYKDFRNFAYEVSRFDAG